MERKLSRKFVEKKSLDNSEICLGFSVEDPETRKKEVLIHLEMTEMYFEGSALLLLTVSAKWLRQENECNAAERTKLKRTWT